jgi:glycine betaine/choline ABC-type transport system substrate-binding protein
MGRTQAVAGLIATLLLAGCGRSGAIVVGSKNFTEQVILGEIVAQHIESRLGVKVDRKLNLGGTLLAHQALVSGQIDLYPEYTGTALTAVLKLPVARDAAEVASKVNAEYRTQWNIEWLPSLGFNNTFAMVITGGFETLSQAAARPQPWKLGVGYEFLTRPDGLPGLLQTYPLKLDGTPRSMDLGLLYQALQQKQVEMVAGNATDGLIAAMKLTVLRDDKGYFPPYEAALAVRRVALDSHPGLRDALAQLSGRISTEAMRNMNYQVDGKHRTVRDVAKEFLDRSLTGAHAHAHVHAHGIGAATVMERSVECQRTHRHA